MVKKNQLHFSYGVVCIKRSKEDGELKYFMIRKRLTYYYMDFCYGRYDTSKPDTVVYLLDHMTRTEKETILRTYDFKIIFSHLMGSNRIGGNEFYLNLYNKFIKAFPTKSVLMSYLDKSTKSGQLIWGFPKGHKASSNEPIVNTSFREFNEESGIPISNIKIFPSAQKEIAHCKYNNIYKISYCYSYLVKDVSEYKYDANEVSDIGWFSKKEIMQKCMVINPKPLISYLEAIVLPRLKKNGLFIPYL